MKKFILLLCLSFVQFSFSQYKNLNEAINDAGKQRMLSQKIAKSYLMIASDVQIDKYQKELDQDMAMFAESLQKLTSYFKDNEIVLKEITKIDRFWLQFREVASSSEYDKDKCNSIIRRADLLLKATQIVVKSIAAKDKTKIGGIIDKSGSLRMLSQKLTVYYVALHLKLSVAGVDERFNETITLLDKRLTDLIALKNFNTDEINSKLKRVTADWSFIKRKLSSNNSSSPAIMAVTLNNLMLQMDEITGLYSKITTN